MIIHGDVAFMLLSSVLVLIMTPGLAFFYAGLVPRKHSLTMMFQSFIAIGIITILWIFGGFGMTFGSDIGGIIGNPLDYFGFKGMDYLMNAIYNENLPFFSFYMYQLMFAIITAPLMTGAYANRLTVPAWIKILIAWMILIYFPVAHWVWGDGFLARLGFVALGAALLLLGWFGFNAGGSLAAAEIATIVFTNTGVAGASAMITNFKEAIYEIFKVSTYIHTYKYYS
ncbi:MAG: ammonium transporter [Clostridium sp.]|nr:ammonium transporter [Clostridium sp.]